VGVGVGVGVGVPRGSGFRGGRSSRVAADWAQVRVGVGPGEGGVGVGGRGRGKEGWAPFPRDGRAWLRK